MRASSFAASRGSRWLWSRTIAAVALSSLPWATAGCSDQGDGEPSAAPREHFPDERQLALEAGTGFVRAVDAAGRPHVRVTAPAAHAAGGRPVDARLAADGDTIPRPAEGARGEPPLADPAWMPAPSMRVPHAYHAATLLQDGRVLVAGGARSHTDPCTTAAELYDPATNTWLPAAPMRGGRCGPGAVLLQDGRVLVAGGHGRYQHFEGDLGLGSAEIYDPATDTWTTAAPMLAARTSDVMDQSAVLLPDGRVLVTGGIDEETRNAEIYDPDADAWTLAAPMLGVITAGELAIVESATLLLDGRVLVAGGGYDASNTWQLAAEIYDPAADTWTAASAADSGIVSFTATRLLDGRVLFVGTNLRNLATSVNTAGLYDPVSDTWTMEDGPGGFEGSFFLGGGNTGHRASLLSDGRVIETGGSLADWFFCGTSACGSDFWRWDFKMAQAYDPATSTWSWLPSMRLERSWHSSTRLLDGRVLIAGGQYSMTELGRIESFAATASTELFLPPGTHGGGSGGGDGGSGGGDGGSGGGDGGSGGDDSASSSSSGAGGGGGSGGEATSAGAGGDGGAGGGSTSAGAGGDSAGAGGGSTSAGAGGDGGAGSTTTSSSGAGGTGGTGGDASTSTSSSSSSAGSGGGSSGGTTAASSSSGAGSPGDTGVATAGGASSSGAGGDGPGGSSSGCSMSSDRAPAGTAADPAWLVALGLLGWSRRRALKGSRHR
ncbi:uncharacterized protein SOCE26_103550 [Sorangium cellulosum]|uniref:Uncharacterized protein n=1 Tax=Sorangium cellulosum TaxID=56 RepID=A0A2L0FB76_SORCE|nr:hypothetical protein [Sorangium cellulosum]AUX48814.1 uncharacterized protein SOCE26_103550 [Sorangium cellulosum]